MANILELILKIKTDELKYSSSIPDGIKNEDIDTLKEKFKSKFKVDIDDQLVNFLRTCDGLSKNGYIVYSSYDHIKDEVEYGLFKNNELWQKYTGEVQYIYFAEGSQDLFAFDSKSLKYELHDRYSFDVHETFQDFDEMIQYILNGMLGIYDDDDDDDENDN
ncbi:MAG: YrhA family protein [Ferruginibacter sp.]